MHREPVRRPGQAAQWAKACADAAPPRSPAPSAPSAAELGLPDAVACPFCGRTHTELHCAFGSRLSVASYWCRDCRTAFEWLRPPAIPAD